VPWFLRSVRKSQPGSVAARAFSGRAKVNKRQGRRWPRRRRNCDRIHPGCRITPITSNRAGRYRTATARPSAPLLSRDTLRL
jgi:hypothetical protein